MNNKKLKSLGRSLRIGCIISVLVICLLMGAAGFNTYYRGMINKYQTYLHDLLALTLTEIDGDDLESCIESGQKSDSFEQTQEFINRIKETYEIEYIYIVKPLNTNETDNMMNVMAGITAEEKAENEDFFTVTFGELTGGNYSADVAAKYLSGMNADSTTFFSNRTEYGHDYTGMIPVTDSMGRPVAVLAADVSMGEIYVKLMQYSLILLLFIVILSAASMAAIFFWLRRRIIQPIEKLQHASASFVESSRSTQDPDKLLFENPEIHTQDEMEELSNTLLAMSEDMKRYMSTLIANATDQERMRAEFNVARQIQTDMLPREFPAFPDRSEFDIIATMEPRQEIGGDFYDYFLVDDDHLALIVGDVADKGIPSALFMVIVKTLIKNRALEGFSPAEVLQSVNEQLLEGNEAGMFSRVWLAVLELSTGKGIAANAGNTHPMLRRAGKRFELQEYRHSPPVGAIEGIRFRDHGFQLSPGDTVFIYTDGVTDAVNEQEEMFGEPRILEALNQEPEASASVLVQAVKQSMERFSGSVVQIDDMTMLALNYYGTGSPEKEWK